MVFSYYWEIGDPSAVARRRESPLITRTRCLASKSHLREIDEPTGIVVTLYFQSFRVNSREVASAANCFLMRGALAASRQGTALAATPLRQAASAAEGGTHAPAKFSPQRML